MSTMDREPFPFTGDDGHFAPSDKAGIFPHADKPCDDFARGEIDGAEPGGAACPPHFTAAQEADTPLPLVGSEDCGAMPHSRAAAFADGSLSHTGRDDRGRDEDVPHPGLRRRRTRFAAAGILGSALVTGCILFLSPWSGAEAEFHNYAPDISDGAPLPLEDAERIGTVETQLQRILEKIAQMETRWPESSAAVPRESDALLQSIKQLREETEARITGFGTQLKSIHEQTMSLDDMGQRLQHLEQHTKIPATQKQETAGRPDFLAVTIKQLGGRSYVTVLDAQGRRHVLLPDDTLNGWRLMAADFQKRAAIFESDDGHRYTSTL